MQKKLIKIMLGVVRFNNTHYYGALGTYINKVIPSKDENAKVDNK
jgi:hypothetical protein